jgi:DNA helicase-2/ATP-dependent DNA helicase PcrA
MKLDDKLYKHGFVHSRISFAKNNLITPEAYHANAELTKADLYAKVPRLSEIYTIYCNRCKHADAMDFDDLLLQTNVLFRNHPDVLQKYQQAFSYILVDEYQDTNFAQYLIVKKLAELHERICVVGDDAQSIYSFRGANIDNILKFKNSYTNAQVFKLEQNYRSTQTIVNAANSLIARNQGQIKKTIWSDNESGTPVQVVRNISDIEEGFFVANNILDSSLSEQRQFSDYAILYRTNAQSRIFEEALRKRNIPYRVYGGVSFYQRKEIKDMLAYLRMTVNRHDNEALRRIINYPARGIGDVTFNKIESWSVNKGISIWETLEQLDSANIDINKGTMAKLNGFVSLINSFPGSSNNENAYEAACTIASASGIKKDLLDSHTPEEKSRIENIDELLNGIKEYVEAAISENMPYNLASYLENISLLTDLDLDKDGDRNHVTIMTIHSAKGLEFSVVYIGGVEDELFPNRQACESQEELEEKGGFFM